MGGAPYIVAGITKAQRKQASVGLKVTMGARLNHFGFQSTPTS